MKKKFVLASLMFAFGMCIMPNVHAASPDSIANLEELQQCLQDRGQSVCTLTDDVQSNNYIPISREVIIDLNNHKITFSGNGNLINLGLYLFNSNVTLKNGTITGENVSTSYEFPSTITLNNSNLKLEKVKVSGQEKAVPINLAGKTNSLNVDSQSEISSTNNAAIVNYSTDGTGTINIYGKVSETGTYSGIDGANTAKETIINVYNGANISSTQGAGILERGDGTVNVYGGNISGFSGIIMVDGNLNITGGNIQGTGNGNPPITPGADGSVKDNGTAVFISPDPDKNVKVDIKGGTLISENNYALSAPGNNENLDISISGGVFNGNSEKGAVEVNGKVSFISGGEFNSDITEYLSEGVTQDEDGKVVDPNSVTPVEKTDDTKNPDTADINLLMLISLITLSGLGLGYTIKKRRFN